MCGVVSSVLGLLGNYVVYLQRVNMRLNLSSIDAMNCEGLVEGGFIVV